MRFVRGALVALVLALCVGAATLAVSASFRTGMDVEWLRFQLFMLDAARPDWHFPFPVTRQSQEL